MDCHLRELAREKYGSPEYCPEFIDKTGESWPNFNELFGLEHFALGNFYRKETYINVDAVLYCGVGGAKLTNDAKMEELNRVLRILEPTTIVAELGTNEDCLTNPRLHFDTQPLESAITKASNMLINQVLYWSISLKYQPMVILMETCQRGVPLKAEYDSPIGSVEISRRISHLNKKMRMFQTLCELIEPTPRIDCCKHTHNNISSMLTTQDPRAVPYPGAENLGVSDDGLHPSTNRGKELYFISIRRAMEKGIKLYMEELRQYGYSIPLASG